MKRERIATAGLLLITCWSAVQYIFLQNVAGDIPNFLFLGLTNLIGLITLVVIRIRKIKEIEFKSLQRGAILALELCGFNLFLLLGSRHLNAVIISGAVSMYFVFVVPILMLMKKKVSFRSAVAAVIAIIALALMFGVDDMSGISNSRDILYLAIADIFFAIYVVHVSEIGKYEKPDLLTICQLFFSAVFSFVGLFVESMLKSTFFTLPSDLGFWISVCFIGVFIRALYGIIQVYCQKYVPPMNASLIFSSEILITMLLNPVMSALFGREYNLSTTHQWIGGALFIIAVLVADDVFMKKFGYDDMEDGTYCDETGKVYNKTFLARKIITMTLTISTVALLVSTGVGLRAIQGIRKTTVKESAALGTDASKISEDALMKQLELELNLTVHDKGRLASEQLSGYAYSIQMAANYASELNRDKDNYGAHPVFEPSSDNSGEWTMQASYANNDVDYELLNSENNLLGNMECIFESIISNYDSIATIYIGTVDGLLISYDKNSENIEAGNYYEFRDSEWYDLGKNNKGATFTDSYQDRYGRGLTITCVAPFFDEKNIFAGCVAMDILVKDMNDALISDGIQEPDKAILLDIDGKIIASKDLDETAEEDISIFDDTAYSILASVSSDILSDKDGLIIAENEEDQYYISHALVPYTNWRLCIISPVSEIVAPAIAIRDNISRNTDNVVDNVIKVGVKVVQDALVLIALLLLAVTYFVGRFSARITGPIKQLQKDVMEISQGHLEKRTSVTGTDEVGLLAKSFNHMTDSLQEHIYNLTEVTAREERIASELSVATRIQANALPNRYPAFPEYDSFDLYATMTPAKEISGDFYDYFMIDDIHLALVIADVSGKGVPAALFMMTAKTLVREKALTGKSPSEILGMVNMRLCEDNAGDEDNFFNDNDNMFVTVWLGIVDITTGKVVSSNAGHEYPAIRKNNGEFELVKTKHSPAVATMDGIRFKEVEFCLEPGDTLFVYTDGIPEAVDESNEFFGTERMLDALNKHGYKRPYELLKSLQKEMEQYIGNADQFDDMTMLAFHYSYLIDKGENL